MRYLWFIFGFLYCSNSIAAYYGVDYGYRVWFSNPVTLSGFRSSVMQLQSHGCELNKVFVVLPKPLYHVHWTDYYLPLHQGMNGSYFFPGSYAGPDGEFTLQIPRNVDGQTSSGKACIMKALGAGQQLLAHWVSADYDYHGMT